MSISIPESAADRGVTEPGSAEIGCVVATHGRLAMELLEIASTILGRLDNIEAVAIGAVEDVDVARERIASAIGRLRVDRGALILTDMFGGSPTNIALTFLDKGHVEVVTGVNLPMLLKVAEAKGTSSVTELAAELRDHAQGSIHVASEVLARVEG